MAMILQLSEKEILTDLIQAQQKVDDTVCHYYATAFCSQELSDLCQH